MKIAKKLVLASSIVLCAFVIVPNVVPTAQKVISVQAASVKLNKKKLTLNTYEKYTLKLKGTKKKAKWSTSNKSIATVSSKGKVTAKKAGNVKITAKVGGKKYTCKVKVVSQGLNRTYITLQKGNTFKLKVYGTNKKVKWSTNKKSVAKVSSKGVVTAVKNGKATITAKVGNKKYKCTVNVTSATYASKIQLSYTKLNNKILVTIKNNNSCQIDYLAADVNFYKNGTLLDTKFFNTVCLTPGTTAYEIVSAPYINSDYLDFDNVTFNISSTSVYSNYLAYKNAKGAVSISHNRGSATGVGVVGTITNLGSKKLSLSATIIYYKNGSIVGARPTYESGIEAGASRSLRVYKDTDKNYKYIDFDSYTLNVDYAYYVD